MSYVDIRYSGTATSSGGFGIFFEQALATTTTTGSTWTTSFYCALVAGSVGNINGIQAGVYFGDTVTQLEFYRSANIAGSLTSSLRRFSQTATAANAGTTRVAPLLEVSYGNTQVIDFTLRIAAPQLEQGAFATSYIPTTTAAATRSADSAVVTPISSFYNQSEGTLFAEVSPRSTTQKPNVPRIAVSLNSGSSDNQINIEQNGTSDSMAFIAYRAAGNNPVAMVGGSSITTTTQRVGGVYGQSDFAASFNGGSAVARTSGTVPSSITHLYIGMRPDAGQGELSGHIRKIAYWPRRLSNTLLQQLTT
jgi:hypothetical protein